MSKNLDLDHIFKHHKPTEDKLIAYMHLRKAAKHFAEAIIELTPPGTDQTTAIRKVREALMTANVAIALDGRLYKKPSLEELEAILNEQEQPPIEILPNGELVIKGMPR